MYCCLELSEDEGECKVNNERKKQIAEITRELYLYPYRSKEENALRGAAWIISWIVGVAAQQGIDQRSIGGTYLMYAVSLLLELLPEKRKNPVAKVVHGIYCAFLLTMVLCSFALIFVNSSSESTGTTWELELLIAAPYPLGCAVSVIIFLLVILSLLEVHKVVYDEEKELQQQIETQREDDRENFIEHLTNIPKGENS